MSLIVMKLQCVLTASDRVTKGNELAGCVQKIEQLQGEKKSIAQDYKTRIDACTLEEGILAEALSQGYEYRDVECDEVPDYTALVVSLYRRDTGDFVQSRPMEAKDKQLHVFQSMEYPVMEEEAR